MTIANLSGGYISKSMRIMLPKCFKYILMHMYILAQMEIVNQYDCIFLANENSEPMCVSTKKL